MIRTYTLSFNPWAAFVGIVLIVLGSLIGPIVTYPGTLITFFGSGIIFVIGFVILFLSPYINLDTDGY